MKNLFLMAFLCMFMFACSGDGKKDATSVSVPEIEETQNTDDLMEPIEASVDDLNKKTEELSDDLDSLINEI